MVDDGVDVFEDDTVEVQLDERVVDGERLSEMEVEFDCVWELLSEGVPLLVKDTDVDSEEEIVVLGVEEFVAVSEFVRESLTVPETFMDAVDESVNESDVLSVMETLLDADGEAENVNEDEFVVDSLMVPVGVAEKL